MPSRDRKKELTFQRQDRKNMEELPDMLFKLLLLF